MTKGVAQQTEQILVNAGAILRAGGKAYADVLKVGVFLADAALPLGARVEMDFVAR